MSKNILLLKCSSVYRTRNILPNSVLFAYNIYLRMPKRTGWGHWCRGRTWDYTFNVKTRYFLEGWFLLLQWGSNFVLLLFFQCVFVLAEIFCCCCNVLTAALKLETATVRNDIILPITMMTMRNFICSSSCNSSLNLCTS